MEPLLLKVTMQPAVRRRDDAATLKQVTMEEVTTEQMAHIDGYRNVSGYMMFSPNKEDFGKMPKDDAVATGRQSKSQQLRFALLRWHLQHGGNKDNFETVYQREMDRIIATVLEGVD